MLQGWTMKLTESTNICCTSDRVTCTIKVNIKETFMGNDGFLQMFIWLMDCSQRIKGLLIDKFNISCEKDGFLLLCPYSGKPLDLC